MRRVGNVSSALALAACCLVCQSVPGASASKFAIKQRQPEITPAPTAVAAAAATESFTAVSDCHQHGTDVLVLLRDICCQSLSNPCIAGTACSVRLNMRSSCLPRLLANCRPLSLIVTNMAKTRMFLSYILPKSHAACSNLLIGPTGFVWLPMGRMWRSLGLKKVQKAKVQKAKAPQVPEPLNPMSNIAISTRASSR